MNSKLLGLQLLEQLNFQIPKWFEVNSKMSIEDILKKSKEIFCSSFIVRSNSRKEDKKKSSNAGMFNSILNVKRKHLYKVVKEQLIEQSVLGGEALDKQSLIVQAMVQPSISGVAFSRIPNEYMPEAVLIECVEGHNEGLTSGSQTPYSFIVKGSEVVGNKKEWKKSILKIAENVRKMEQKLGYPVDVEWAIENETLYFLQCRRITRYWDFWWDDKEPMWATDITIRTNTRIKDKYSKHIKHGFYKIRNLRIQRGNQGRTTATVLKPIQHKSLKKLNHYLDKAEKACRKQAQIFKELKQRLSQLSVKSSNKELLSFWHHAISVYAEFSALYSLTDSILTEKIAKREKSEIQVVDELVYKQMEDLRRMKQNGYTKSDLTRHLEKFPYVVQNIYEREKALEFVQFMVDNSSIKQHKKMAFPQKCNTIGERQAIFRMKIKNGWAGMDYYLIDFFDILSKRYNETVENLQNNYLLEDIENLILTGTKQNRNGIVWQITNNRLSIHNYKENNYNHLQSKNLKGFVANSGDMEGEVFVLNTHDSLDKNLKEKVKNKIVVSQMIQPRILPLIDTCIGFVTDEGGVLSHAAIIARELNIPALVGTKYATKILNSGDIVKIIDGFLIIKKKLNTNAYK